MRDFREPILEMHETIYPHHVYNTMTEWHGIMKVDEFRHETSDGRLLYLETGLKNIMHLGGESFILKVLFGGGSVPENYYIGLDSRSSLDRLSGIESIQYFEPNINSYSRQSVSSAGFSIMPSQTGGRQANSPTVLFRASGGSWGPVRNIFMTTGLGYGSSASLISSISLSRYTTVQDGEIITMRMSMALSGC